MTSKQLETAQEKVDHVDQHEPANDYRSPQMFDLGSAVELVQRSFYGQLRDGTGGWYVYGS